MSKYLCDTLQCISQEHHFEYFWKVAFARIARVFNTFKKRFRSRLTNSTPFWNNREIAKKKAPNVHGYQAQWEEKQKSFIDWLILTLSISLTFPNQAASQDTKGLLISSNNSKLSVYNGNRNSQVDFNVIYQPDLPKPGSNTEHHRTTDLLHCLQTFLVYNLVERNNAIRT